MAAEVRNGGPMDRLKGETGGLLNALTDRATDTLREKVEGAASRLTDYVEGNGGPGLIAAVTGAKGMAEGKGPIRSMLGAGFAGARQQVAGIFGGGRGKQGGQQQLKVTTIVESIDVGVPSRVAYNEWTQFRDFPTFMKKVENVEQADDEKLNWKAQVWWSHRTWEATILEQHPDERIVWRSKGEKGHVDGAVSFHQLTPNLTRIVLVMEYHPQGLFEHTGNLWRAQGRRARLELKHFDRHVMSHVMLNPDEVEGWRGVIEDGEVVMDHETALREEERERGEEPRDYESEEESEQDEDEEGGEEEPRDEAPGDQEPQDEEAADAGRDGGRAAARRRAGTPGRGSRGGRPAAARAGQGQERPARAAHRGARL